VCEYLSISSLLHGGFGHHTFFLPHALLPTLDASTTACPTSSARPSPVVVSSLLAPPPPKSCPTPDQQVLLGCFHRAVTTECSRQELLFNTKHSPASILRRCVLNFSLRGLPLNLLSCEIPLSFPREAALLYPSHTQVCQTCRLNLFPTAHLKIVPPCSMVTAPYLPPARPCVPTPCRAPLGSSSAFGSVVATTASNHIRRIEGGRGAPEVALHLWLSPLTSSR
jgi:hypothetical protein